MDINAGGMDQPSVLYADTDASGTGQQNAGYMDLNPGGFTDVDADTEVNDAGYLDVDGSDDGDDDDDDDKPVGTVL
jgi:hypothetical protein